MFNAYIQGVKYIGKNVIGLANLQIAALPGCPGGLQKAVTRERAARIAHIQIKKGRVIDPTFRYFLIHNLSIPLQKPQRQR
jgi:hypothetical protein